MNNYRESSCSLGSRCEMLCVNSEKRANFNTVPMVLQYKFSCQLPEVVVIQLMWISITLGAENWHYADAIGRLATRSKECHPHYDFDSHHNIDIFSQDVDPSLILKFAMADFRKDTMIQKYQHKHYTIVVGENGRRSVEHQTRFGPATSQPTPY